MVPGNLKKNMNISIKNQQDGYRLEVEISDKVISFEMEGEMLPRDLVQETLRDLVWEFEKIYANLHDCPDCGAKRGEECVDYGVPDEEQPGFHAARGRAKMIPKIEDPEGKCLNCGDTWGDHYADDDLCQNGESYWLAPGGDVTLAREDK